MAEHSCCHGTSGSAGENRKRRRVLRSTKWIAPAAVLALLPKCPMCLAGYIALATGFSVSLSAALWLRTGLLVACLCVLLGLSILVARYAGSTKS